MRALGGFHEVFDGGFARAGHRLLFRAAFGGAVFLFPFGVLFNVTDLLPAGFAWSASVVILLYGVAVLLSEFRAAPPPRAAAEFAAIALCLFLVEYLGVTTGFPFGSYVYTGALQPLVWGVPVVMAVAWYTTVVCTRRMAGWLLRSAGARPSAVAALAALLTVALDVVLEPMASDTRQYWIWSGGPVPWQNYAAWFLLSFAAVHVLENRAVRREAPDTRVAATAAAVYSMQTVLFSLSNLAHGHAAETAAGLALAGAAVLISGALARLFPASEVRVP